MIDNKEQISKLLKWDSDDEFYFIQVLKRKKENKELGSNSHVVKTYYIKSLSDLEKDWEEMKLLADFHNARIYINLNKRSFEKTCFHTLKKITDQIMNKDYKQVRKAYNSVCGEFATGDKTWVIDIDNKDIRYIDEHIKVIEDLQPIGETKILDLIPTKNGYHLLSKPFNLQEFKKVFPETEVHKNNPTIMMIP